MPRLLLITGCSGSGKTSAAKYAERPEPDRKIRAVRYSIDHYMSRISPTGNLRAIINVLPYGGDLWNAFPALVYHLEDAAAAANRYFERLAAGDYEIPMDYRLVIGAGLYRSYLDSLNETLLSGKDAVHEGGPGMSRVFALAECGEKYIIELKVRPETAIARKMDQMKWPQDKAERTVWNSSVFRAPDCALEYWRLPNETKYDFDLVKRKIDGIFGPETLIS